jgi:hypothetical protein
MSGELAQVEILCEVLATANGKTRCLAREAKTDAWYLIERDGKDAPWRRISRGVTATLAHDVAVGILAGDSKALTLPEAPRILAIALGVMLYHATSLLTGELAPPSPRDPAAEIKDPPAGNAAQQSPAEANARPHAQAETPAGGPSSSGH